MKHNHKYGFRVKEAHKLVVDDYYRPDPDSAQEKHDLHNLARKHEERLKDCEFDEASLHTVAIIGGSEEQPFSIINHVNNLCQLGNWDRAYHACSHTIEHDGWSIVAKNIDVSDARFLCVKLADLGFDVQCGPHDEPIGGEKVELR